MEREIKRGDMYYTYLKPGSGSEQRGYRPVVVLQNNIGNLHSKTVITATITSRVVGKKKMPTHCLIRAQQGLKCDSLALLEQIQTIDKARLQVHIGTLDNETMNEIDKALAISVGLNMSS